MKSKSLPGSVPASVGLAALAVYVLACTSFSPDDSQVLFPTYDPEARDFGVGLYNRKTGNASTLFVPQQPAPDESHPDFALLRPHWLADGRHILVAWLRDAGDEALELAVLPQGQPGTTRFMHLEGIPDAGSQLASPLAVADSQLFLVGESNSLVRVNLLTGEVVRHAMPRPVTPYGSLAPGRIGYLAEADQANETVCEVGFIHPATFALEPKARFKHHLTSDDFGLCGVSPDGKWVVLAANDGEDAGQIRWLEGDVERRRWRPFPDTDTVKLGAAAVNWVQRNAYVPFVRKAADENHASLGVVEVAFTGDDPRRISLVSRVKGDDLGRILYFQPSLSHDGTTLAVATTYLAAGDDQIAPEDCGLFLVDLADPQRPVTRVPVPRPPRELD